MVRYKYTFNQVISEAFEYNLIVRKGQSKEVFLIDIGEEAINHYKQGNILEFNKYIFPFMERKYRAFYYLINTCYEANCQKAGLLILPIYSPLVLPGFNRKSIKTSADLIEYLKKLQLKLEQDIETHLDKYLYLEESNKKLIKRLINPNFNFREQF